MAPSIAAGLRRDASLPLAELAAKILRSGLALATAPLYLRGCTSVAVGARTFGRPLIRNRGRITIGKDFMIGCQFAVSALETGPRGVLSIGDDVIINYGVSISAVQSVTIEEGARISPYCVIADSDGSGRVLPIRIGAGCWLAGRVTVLPGADIGAGSVIAAGSVVDGSIPPGVVAAGVPARVLRKTEAAAAREEKRPARREGPFLRGLLIGDFNLAELARALEEGPEEPAIEAQLAPCGEVEAALRSPRKADFAVVWTRPEAAAPAFARVLACEEVDDAELHAEVDAFAERIAAGLAPYRAAFVPAWTLPSWERGLGMSDARPGGAWRALSRMNAWLVEALEPCENLFVLPAERWMRGAGYDSRLWYLGKAALHPEALGEAARDLKAALRGLTGGARTLLVVDLDDTLWGGAAAGGWEGLRVGGDDPEGRAYADLQRAMLALARRGVRLAVVSRNAESAALEAIARHPGMVLKQDDFAGWKIDPSSPAGNLTALANDLGVGLGAVVYVSGDPSARALVRKALPQVLVPDWPADPLAAPAALKGLRCFDLPVRGAGEGRAEPAIEAHP